MDEINRRLAWIHLEASTLQADDLFELKHSLKALVTEADALRELVKSELGKHTCQPGVRS